MLGDNIQIIDASLTGIDLLEHVSAEHEAKGLHLPHVPDPLVSTMQQLNSPFLYASASSLPLPLDSIPAWLQAVVAPDNDEQNRLMNQNYLYFGEAGYGVNSIFYHYYLHIGPVYLFYRHPYGGVYQDNESAAAKINADQQAVAQTFAQMAEEPTRQGDPVAIVADGKAGRYGWATIMRDGFDNWQDGALDDALKELRAHSESADFHRAWSEAKLLNSRP